MILYAESAPLSLSAQVKDIRTMLLALKPDVVMQTLKEMKSDIEALKVAQLNSNPLAV